MTSFINRAKFYQLYENTVKKQVKKMKKKVCIEVLKNGLF